MTWIQLLPLIVEYGLPFAERLVINITGAKPVTPELIAELKSLSQQTPRTQLLEALARKGIDINSPKAIELLSLLEG